MLKPLLAFALTLGLSVPAAAEPYTHLEADFIVYAADGLVVRPIALVGTAIGTTVYLLTLPFAFTAQDPSTFDVLVREPAAYTFTRCFGCGVGEIVR